MTVQISAKEMDEFRKLTKKVDSSVIKFKNEKTILTLAKVFENYWSFRKPFLETMAVVSFDDNKAFLNEVGLKLESLIEKELKSFCDDTGKTMSRAYDVLHEEYICRECEGVKY